MESIECRLARLVTEAIFAKLSTYDGQILSSEALRHDCYLAALEVVRPIIEEVDNAERC